MSQYLRKLCLFYVLVVASASVIAEDNIEQNEKEAEESNTIGNEIEDLIIAFEHFAKLTESDDRNGILSVDEVEQIHDNMVQPVKGIIELLKDESNVYKFIEAKGIQRVILPYLQVYNPELRGHLLTLTKLLFDGAPTTTSVMIPIKILDTLLDIYEDEDDAKIRAQTIDILNDWLPENPKVQARVMKFKGLEFFYQNLRKSDPKSVFTQLKLFSKILKEHLKVRMENQDKSKKYPTLNVYKKIGLIERLTSTNICHGLFNIFDQFYNPYDKDFTVPVFEILMDSQPYCSKQMKGQLKAAHVVKELQKRVREMNEDDRNDYLALGIDVTALEKVLAQYLEDIDLHDEF